MGAVASAGCAPGVLLGGILTSGLSWRWVLFVNVPIGLVAALLASRTLVESRAEDTWPSLSGPLRNCGSQATAAETNRSSARPATMQTSCDSLAFILSSCYCRRSASELSDDSKVTESDFQVRRQLNFSCRRQSAMLDVALTFARTAGDVRAPLPAAMPAGCGRARKARLICSGAAGRLNCLMGVQLGGKGHLGWFAGAAAAVRGLPGSSGRLSPCLPDDGAPRLRRPVLACSSVPADRGHRFRRSGARTGHAVGRRRRYSLVGCRPGGPCRVSFDW